ncbi:VOC family protein [Streptomyces sp. NPDC090499]|uniref:VOC family protein n=1 Tax=Streptomyces sp. NPDC090499 TaxID=3365965 RepID=UPI00380F42F7
MWASSPRTSRPRRSSSRSCSASTGATTWADPPRSACPPGDAVIDFRCAYARSASPAPRLEIVQRVPGTLWEPTPGSGIHHFGYWSDDVAADTAELERHGYVTEATRKGPDGGLFFAFLRSGGATGFRVELVSRAAQPSLEQSWAR